MMKLKGGHSGRARREGWLVRAYGWVLKLVLANRGITLLASAVALVSVVIAFFGIGRYRGWGAGMEFFPDTDPRRLQINIKTAEGTLLDKTNEVALEIEERLKTVPDVDYVTTNVGTGGGNVLRPGARAANRATIAMELVDRQLRSQSSVVTTKQIREAVADIPGAIIDVQKEEMGPPAGEPIEVEISGEDVERLARLLGEVYAKIKDTPGLVDLKDDFVASKPEIQFPVSRSRAALVGMSTTWVAEFIKMYVQGIKLGDYREGEEEYEIYVRADDAYRYDVNKLMSQYIPDATGNMVPLSTLVDTRYVGGYGNIARCDRKRAITITGRNAEGYNAKAVLGEVRTRLADVERPPGYRIRFRGEDEESQKASAFLFERAFPMALMGIALLLISQFNSIAKPFIIMVAVLMSLVGVLAGLLITGLPFGIIMSGIGVIGLAGVVVNNGIVLIAYTRQLESYGLDSYSAIVKAGKTRLRPVLLTAITTILALVPMAVGVTFNIHDGTWDVNSESSQMWRNMAISVIFGIAMATFLTLLLEPALYSLFSRAGTSGEGATGGEVPPALAPKAEGNRDETANTPE